VKAVQDAMPSGMERILSILDSCIKERPAEKQPENREPYAHLQQQAQPPVVTPGTPLPAQTPPPSTPPPARQPGPAVPPAEIKQRVGYLPCPGSPTSSARSSRTSPPRGGWRTSRPRT